MLRVELDELFKTVHRNFDAVMKIHLTFRHFNIAQLVEAGITADDANQLYERQINKIQKLINKLEAFPETTSAELSNNQVAEIIQALKRRIDSALQIKSDNDLFKNAWATCTLREANLQHSNKASLRSIEEFVNKHHIFNNSQPAENPKPVLGNYSQNNGFGGFTHPRKITLVINKHPSHISTGTIKKMG